MCTLQAWTCEGAVRGQGGLGTRNLSHGRLLLMVNGRQTMAGGVGAHLLALVLLAAVGGGHDLVCAGLVRGVVEQRANVLNKKRVKKLGNLFLVGKLESSIIGNPIVS